MIDDEKEIYLLMIGWKKFNRRAGYDGYTSTWKTIWTFATDDSDCEEFDLNKAYDIAIKRI